MDSRHRVGSTTRALAAILCGALLLSSVTPASTAPAGLRAQLGLIQFRKTSMADVTARLGSPPVLRATLATAGRLQQDLAATRTLARPRLSLVSLRGPNGIRLDERAFIMQVTFTDGSLTRIHIFEES